MPLQIVIPDSDPLVKLLLRRAHKRGFGSDRASARKKLPELGRILLRERLADLEEHGDTQELPRPTTGAAN